MAYGIGGTTGPDDAAALVNEAWDYYRGLGDEWINLSRTTIADLTSVHIQPISVSVNYDVDSFLPAFRRPDRPEAPEFGTITPNTTNVPTLDGIAVRVLGDAPAEPDFSGLVYSPPTAPNQAMPTAPNDVLPVLDAIVVPARPDYVLPAVPTLFDLDLPTVPVITLPTFDGVRPVFDIAMPEDGQLAWAEVTYTSTLKDALTAKITDMLQGGLGLPLAVEQALFDRGRAREDRLSRKQIMEVADDMGMRGLSEPNGILAKRLQQVRADNRDKGAGLNRDLTIKTAEIALENVKFALGQGMALEQVLIQQNLAINDRALRAAMFVREYGISRVNALISYANLQQAAYATDAQVWKTRIEGELSKLDVIKAEIDAQRLVGEINRDLVARYEAQLRGVLAMSEFYKTDVDAAKVKGEINNQRIDAAKLILERYSTEVDGWGKLQDGYKTQVEAALGTTKFAETMASIYATRMGGYKTKGDAYFQEGRFQIERNGQTLDLFRAELQGAEQYLRGQLAQLDAKVRTFGAETELYRADGSLAHAESAATDRTVQLRVENERNRTQVALQQAEININQALKIGEILVEQIKAKSATIAQLAAASQSGVNFGASMSAGQSKGYSYGRNYSYSGDTPDDSPEF